MINESAMKTGCVLVLLVLSSAVFSLRGYAMATEQIGPDPPDRPTVAQPGWPKGIAELARHPSRVYSIWVNGNEEFYFKSTPEQINELLTLLGQARMRDHEIRVLPGSGEVSSFQRQKFEYHVGLHVVTGIALAHTQAQLQKGKPADLPLEPRLTIYSEEGEALVKQLTWPANAIIDCQVPGLSIPSPQVRPNRSSFYGQLEFAADSPTRSFVQNVATRISFWERGFETGISLAQVDREGRFAVGFSPEEMASLQAGKTWLTVTLGNWLTEPRPTDQRFPVEKLASAPDKTKPVPMGGAPCYYGRLLFEDGGPPKLDPEPWPGARIMIDFPYAGSSEPDAEGYFQVVLTPEQFEDLQRRNPRKNVYVPSDTPRGSSTAQFIYPVSLLADSKAKAGVLKIPRPVP